MYVAWWRSGLDRVPFLFHVCVAHVVGCVGVSSITQVLLHHRQFVLHGCSQEQLLIHKLGLECGEGREESMLAYAGGGDLLSSGMEPDTSLMLKAPTDTLKRPRRAEAEDYDRTRGSGSGRCFLWTGAFFSLLLFLSCRMWNRSSTVSSFSLPLLSV